ncbi:hypothetical protein GEMRC1_005010 [Eukaryota sp. GEM-RC1]
MIVVRYCPKYSARIVEAISKTRKLQLGERDGIFDIEGLLKMIPSNHKIEYLKIFYNSPYPMNSSTIELINKLNIKIIKIRIKLLEMFRAEEDAKYLLDNIPNLKRVTVNFYDRVGIVVNRDCTKLIVESMTETLRIFMNNPTFIPSHIVLGQLGKEEEALLKCFPNATTETIEDHLKTCEICNR